MGLDLLLRDVALADGRRGVDVACRGGRIVEVAAAIEGRAEREIDAAGQLLIPPFVDAHFHLDATLSLGRPRLNRSGTLLEGIALWNELKALQSEQEIHDRAISYCDLAVSQGLLAVRSHVDVCDDALKGVRALLAVREAVATYLDLQLVGFPQDGLYRSANARANLLRALDMGVEVVGGIPHFERSRAEGDRSVRELCELAAERGLAVDLHCDESDDPQSRHIETLALESERLGLGGRVAASHLTSMHSMDNYYVSKLLPMIAEAGVAAIANPLINITLQGRHDSYPKRRGQTRVPELLEHGVAVAFGSDCVMDPWYPLGRADMLEVASMGLHVGQLTSREQMAWCLAAVTTEPARIMGLSDYGIAPGCRADMVLLQARDAVEALRLRATRLLVVRAGRVIAETPAAETSLYIDGRPARVSALSVSPSQFAPGQ